ncbi:hypothetical protein [Gimesia maris]|uniref:hypothetical protein n=1 Tax=Gimesia maris TaxID=122 RepID=UPI0030D8923D|tara:strand:- start:106360 stop:106869 length:510 start_codon:yes stop_codon:yes gene_type:complete
MLFKTSEGEIALADSLMDAISRKAEQVADLTGKELRKLFPGKSPENIRLPKNLYLELGAVLQIGYWESNGISAHIAAGVPSKAEALSQLSERLQKGAAEFTGDDSIYIHRKSFCFWIQNLAWDGPSLMNTEMVLGEIQEDQFMDLAEFLWKHRLELKSLLIIKETQNGK